MGTVIHISPPDIAGENPSLAQDFKKGCDHEVHPHIRILELFGRIRGMLNNPKLLSADISSLIAKAGKAHSADMAWFDCVPPAMIVFQSISNACEDILAGQSDYNAFGNGVNPCCCPDDMAMVSKMKDYADEACMIIDDKRVGLYVMSNKAEHVITSKAAELDFT